MEPGRYLNVPEADYHGGLGVSKSNLDLINKTPLHFKEEKENPSVKDTRAKIFGRALHCAVLEPERFMDEFACEITPEDYPGCLEKSDEIKEMLHRFYAKDVEKIAGLIFDWEMKLTDLNKSFDEEISVFEKEMKGIAPEHFETKKAYNEALKPMKDRIKELKASKKIQSEEIKAELKTYKEEAALLKSHCTGKKSELIERLKEVCPDVLIWDEIQSKFFANNVGKTILKKDDYIAIEKMTKNIYAHPAAKVLFTKGQNEVSYYWNDPKTGELCRCRFDKITDDGIAIDFKTTDDASMDGFEKSVKKWRYEVQDAHYSDGYLHVHGEPLKAFLFVFCEKTPPYAIGIYQLPAEWKLLGRLRRDKNLATFSECKQKDEWPGYPPTIQTAEMPGYLKYELEKLEVENEQHS